MLRGTNGVSKSVGIPFMRFCWCWSIEIEIYLKFASTNIDSQREKLFSRKITYNNSDDKFKLKKYEDELEDILITKIVEDLINYLSSI